MRRCPEIVGHEPDRSLVRLFLSLVVAALAGGSGSNRTAVRGKVTLDSEPIKQGRITFFPAEGNMGPNAGAGILNGEYDIPARNGVVIGKNRVSINSSRKTGRKVRGPMGSPVDERVEGVPRKYHGEKSELIRDVQLGRNQFDFDLKSE